MAEMESLFVRLKARRDSSSGKPISFNCSTKDSSSSTAGGPGEGGEGKEGGGNEMRDGKEKREGRKEGMDE